MQRLPDSAGPLASISATGVLLGLLYRSLGRAEASPTLFMLGFVRAFGPAEWVLILSTGVACIVAVAKRQPMLLHGAQALSLAAGLLLTHYNLGTEVGEHVDPRFVFAITAGAASLHCCYLCLLAYLAMAFSRRKMA